MATLSSRAAQHGATHRAALLPRTTRGLLIAATLLGGILAGGNVNRNLVHMPAWHHVGVLAWAAFSRYADLGLNGMIVYPLEGIGGAVLTVAAAIAYHFDRSAPRSAAIAIYAAAGLVVGGMLATTQAAPIMMSVRHLGDDPVALQQAFDGFEFWGRVRGIFQIAAFVANLWSLVAVYRATAPVRARDRACPHCQRALCRYAGGGLLCRLHS